MTRHAPTRRSRRVLLLLLVAVLAAGVTAAFAWWFVAPPAPERTEAGTGASASAPTPSRPLAPTPTPAPEPDAEFTIVATGDLLPHMPVLVSARTDEGGHDFGPLLSGIDPWVRGADLALCHLEVPIVPEGESPSGFPLFGTVPQLADDLRTQGWTGCSTASNHSVDRGYAGVTSTLDTFDAAGLGHVGTARSTEEAAAPQLYELEREGRTITVAQLSATYSLNGLSMPAEAPWAATLIDTDELVAQAAAARDDGADLVVVSIHAGVEYVSAPTPEQEEIARVLAASGEIDLYVGHHAHVPQPVELLPGGPDDEGMWTAYGLGNFLSNQGAHCCTPRTDSGLLLTATVTQPADGPARVTAANWTAVTVDLDGGHRVHAIAEVLDEGTGSLSPAELRARYDRVLDAVGTGAPERTEPPVATGPPATVVPRGAAATG
ncbi:CapA family protein [Oerskovia flava]|uniref:CapA family protein n=1 Tax=Oerskovia flava TaxID=2986422 RepID=UPI0022402E0A|nr:CapA family protein [Oerskovia sp. JB1-3-2]